MDLRSLTRNSPLIPIPRRPFFERRYPFRRKGMNQALGAELAAPTTWKVADAPVGGAVAEVFEQTPNIQKMPHYLPVYETALPTDVPIRMLEIGVARGGSMQMWRKYLHPESVIVGIDIDTATKQFDDPDRHIHVRIGSQADTEFLQTVTDEFGPFEVVLDDGSHMASHMVETFRYLFPRIVPGGMYIIEDIHSNYWTLYRDQSLSFADFTKALIDAMHAQYLPMADEHHFREDHPQRMHEVTVPLAAVITEKVEFYDSIAVIHRAREGRGLPRSVRR